MSKCKRAFSKALSAVLAAAMVLSTVSLLGSFSAVAEEVPAHQFEGFENDLNAYNTNTVFERYESTGADDKNVHSGNYSLHNSGTEANHTWYLNSNLKVESGKRYAVSFWYKGGKSSATSVALSLFGDQSLNEWINGTQDGEWVYYSKIITATNDNVGKHLGIMVYKNVGDIYFDDICVDEVSSSYYSENFENGFAPYNASQVTVSFETENGNSYLKGVGGGNTTLNLPIFLDSSKKYTVSFDYKASAWWCWYNGTTQYGLGGETEWKHYEKSNISGSDNLIKFYAANGVTFNIDNVVIREHLSATYEATEFGTVTVSNPAPLYGDEVTYSVTPNEGYTFKGWQNADGDIVSTSATYTFKITANTVLTPVFNEVTLYNCAAISADENMGTAEVDKSKVYGESTAVFTAAAKDEYEFSAWLDKSGAVVSTLNPYRMVITADTTLTAKFGTAERGVQKEGFENSPSISGPYNGGSGSYSIYNSYSDGGNTAYVNSGYSSLLIAQESNNYGVRINSISFKSGKTYSISFKYRKTAESSGTWFYVLGNGNYSANAADEWKTFSKTVTFDNDINYFEVSTTACGGLLIDDILVREINKYDQRQGFEYDDVSISNIGDDTAGNGKSVIYTQDAENYDTSNVKSGTRSLEIKHSADNTKNLRTRIYGFTLTAGKTYNLTFSYKTPENAVWFYAIDSTVAPIQTAKSSEWQTYSIDYTPANDATIIDFGTTTADALLYIDDIILREKADYSVTANKESARIDYVNVTADTIYVSDEIGFTVKKTDTEDTVEVKVNGSVYTPDASGVYTVTVPETMEISLNISGTYSDSLPAAGKGKNDETLDSYDEETAMKEIWYGDTVYHESVLFYDSEISGKQVKRDRVKLLYPAKTVVSLRSYDLKTYYVLGVDYVIDNGELVLTENSAIPVYTGALTALRKDKDTEGDSTVASGDSSYADYYWIDDTYGLKLIASDKQHNVSSVMVTYTHSTEWSDGEGYNPKAVKAQGSKLTNLYKKLDGKSTEDINVLVYGASSATGASSSGANVNYVLFDKDGKPVKSSGRAPYAPSYFELAVNALVREYGNNNKVNYYNIALGGQTSKWGLDNLDSRLEILNKYYQTEKSDSNFEVVPDVIIIAFNGNDFLTDIAEFKGNISGMVTTFKTLYPNADIILPSEKMNNNACYMYSEERALAMQEKLQEVADENSNVICASVTDVFASIIDSKVPVDYLSNNINHGNDFYARVFAQVIFNAAERHIRGDANNDNAIDIRDLVRVKKYLSNTADAAFNYKAANINLDNKVDARDLAALRKILLGIFG